MREITTGRRICVTGGSGFLGRQVVSTLRNRGIDEANLIVPRSSQYDLTIKEHVRRLFADYAPEVVIHLAAVVGGIGANRVEPGRFFYANMTMGLNLIEEARQFDVLKFVQIGTVCAYPKFCSVPFREHDLWSGYPEETNAPYGIAKRALSVMLDSYQRQYGLTSVYLLPVNLYGPHDNFDAATSHVIPALIRKIERVRIRGENTVECWGTGNASREFLHVYDAAEAIVRATERITEPTPINLGTGVEVKIRELAELIAAKCGYDGELRWNADYPDGQQRRCLDTTRAQRMLDWTASTELETGIRETVAWYRRARCNKDD